MNVKTVSTRMEIVKRSKGQNAVDRSAYISRTTIQCERTGETYYPKYSEDLVYSEVMIPEGAPEKLKDRTYLWNSIENLEKRKDAQVARTFRLSLPNEWSYDLATEVMRDYVKKNFVDEGMCCDFAIHDSENKTTHQRNLHCHIMLTMRPLNKDGTWGDKQHLVYDLDENGEKIKKKNGRYKSHTVKTTDWDSKEKATLWRKNLADTINHINAGLGTANATMWEYKSFKDRGLDILPQVHLGAKACALERKGVHTDAGDTNRMIVNKNMLIEITVIACSDAKKKIKKVKAMAEKAAELGKNEVLRFLNMVAKKKGYLELPLLSGGAIRYVSDREDLQDIEKAKNFIIENDINTFDEMYDYRSEHNYELMEKEKKKKKICDEIDELDILIQYHDEFYLPLKKIHDEYKNLKFIKKMIFEKEHESDLREYEDKRDVLKCIKGANNAITPKEWKRKRSKLIEQYAKVKEELAEKSVGVAYADTISINKKFMEQEYRNEMSKSMELDTEIKRKKKDISL